MWQKADHSRYTLRDDIVIPNDQQMAGFPIDSGLFNEALLRHPCRGKQNIDRSVHSGRARFKLTLPQKKQALIRRLSQTSMFIVPSPMGTISKIQGFRCQMKKFHLENKTR